MNVLIVEDDEIKFNAISSFLKDEEVFKDINISWKKSWHSGLLSILHDDYTLVLLDMSMPRYDPEIGNVNEEFEPFAGQEILTEMNRRKINIPVIVITSFEYIGKDDYRINSDILNLRLEKDYKNYLGMVKFNSTSSEWKQLLKERIDRY